MLNTLKSAAAVLVVIILAPLAAQAIVINDFQKLLAPDTAPFDDFGFGAGISGNVAIVGVRLDDDKGEDSGAAYLYHAGANGNWVPISKLTASDGAAGDQFGTSAAISGNTALVSAPLDNTTASRSGSAYVFRQNAGGNWVQIDKLQTTAAGLQFADSLALNGDTAVIGSPYDPQRANAAGAAYVFRDNGTGHFVQVAKLFAGDAASGDGFGASVAVSGNTAIISATLDDTTALDTGSAYIFRPNSSGAWTQVAKLVASDAATSQWFGASVAISGDTAMVGAFSDDDRGQDSGAVYVFRENASGAWDQIAKLTAPGAARYFGYRVALDGPWAVIGAPQSNDQGNASGAAFIYHQDDAGDWYPFAKLLPHDGTQARFFGSAPAISDRTVIVGVSNDHSAGLYAGSAYLFQIPEPPTCLLATGFTMLLARRRKRTPAHRSSTRRPALAV